MEFSTWTSSPLNSWKSKHVHACMCTMVRETYEINENESGLDIIDTFWSKWKNRTVGFVFKEQQCNRGKKTANTKNVYWVIFMFNRTTATKFVLFIQTARTTSTTNAQLNKRKMPAIVLFDMHVSTFLSIDAAFLWLRSSGSIDRPRNRISTHTTTIMKKKENRNENEQTW